jgi:hypothetical protein
MIAFSALALLLLGVLALLPVRLMRQRQSATWWDYASPFLGLPLWFALIAARIGSVATLSNFVIEVLGITLASITAAWLRWGLSFAPATPWRAVSLGLSLVPVAAAAALRLAMPSLPE